MRWIIAIWMLILVAAPLSAHASQPLDELKGQVDLVMNILKDPQYQNESQREQQRKKMWEIIERVFDFEEMSKSALGRYRERFDQQQREEFVKLFADLLGNTYLDRIQRGFRNEKVTYLAEEKLADNKVLVKTKIVRESMEIPVSYSMFNRNSSWRVYDVSIEGVGLVNNYRAQFSKILLNKPPAHLIEMLKNKLELQKKEKPDKK